MFVKICGLSKHEHVEAAVAAGADAVGFVFAESVRRIDPASAAEIAAAVPNTVKKVAVMLHPSNAEWQAVLDDFTPDVLQTDAEDFDALDVPASIERWAVHRESKMGSDRLLSAESRSDPIINDPIIYPTESRSDPIVYEGARSGQGETVDWTRAADIARQGKMILAGGLGPDNVAAAIAAVRPWGVDVSSGVESAPGRKDARLIERFISAARAAETNE